MQINTPPASNKFRVLHRYLGFFLAGIMAVYAISGIILIFRKTDFLKKDVVMEKQLEARLSNEQFAEALRIKELRVKKTEGNVVYFPGGSYDGSSGRALQTKKELPYFLKQMTHLHKSTTNDPLYWLNIFFGGALLFFVISAFWMFMPGSKVLQKGLWFSLGGIALTLILLFI